VPLLLSKAEVLMGFGAGALCTIPVMRSFLKLSTSSDGFVGAPAGVFSAAVRSGVTVSITAAKQAYTLNINRRIYCAIVCTSGNV
jgi:hypothetical protein